MKPKLNPIQISTFLSSRITKFSNNCHFLFIVLVWLSNLQFKQELLEKYIQIINIIFMSDRRQLRRRCDQDCQDHIFNFKKIGSSSKYDYQDSFCPKYQRDPQVPQHTLPIFNNDGRYYTAGFIPGVDLRQLQKNLQQELMGHQKLVKDSMQKPTQIKFPRPNPKHSKLPTCSVCKVMCTNYYEHIRSIEHHENIANNLYNKFLLQLCQNYREFWDGCQEKADADIDRISEFPDEQDEQQDENQNQSRSDRQDQQDDEENQNSQESLNQSKRRYINKIRSRKRPPIPLLCDVIKKKIKIDYGESLQIISLKPQQSDVQIEQSQQKSSKDRQDEQEKIPNKQKQQSEVQQKESQKQIVESKKQEELKINQKDQQSSEKQQMQDLKPQKIIKPAHKDNKQGQKQPKQQKVKDLKKDEKQQKYYLRHKTPQNNRQKKYNYRDANYQYSIPSKYNKYNLYDNSVNRSKNQTASHDPKINKYTSQPKYTKQHEPSNLQPYPQYLKKMQKQRQEQQSKNRQASTEKSQDYYNTRNHTMMYNIYQPTTHNQQWHPNSYPQQAYYYPPQPTMGSSQQSRKIKNNHTNQNSATPSHMNHSYVGNTSININFPLYISPPNYPMNMYRGYPNPYNVQYPYQTHGSTFTGYPDYSGKHYQTDKKDDKN